MQLGGEEDACQCYQRHRTYCWVSGYPCSVSEERRSAWYHLAEKAPSQRRTLVWCYPQMYALYQRDDRAWQEFVKELQKRCDYRFIRCRSASYLSAAKYYCRQLIACGSLCDAGGEPGRIPTPEVPSGSLRVSRLCQKVSGDPGSNGCITAGRNCPSLPFSLLILQALGKVPSLRDSRDGAWKCTKSCGTASQWFCQRAATTQLAPVMLKILPKGFPRCPKAARGSRTDIQSSGAAYSLTARASDLKHAKYIYNQVLEVQYVDKGVL